MEEIAKNYLEVIYKEYKDYENFAKTLAPNILKGREELAKIITEKGIDSPDIIDKIVEFEFKPTLYQTDLQRLQLRLVYVVDAYSQIIEIPKELLEEVSKLRPKFLYKPDGNDIIELEPETIKNVEDNFKTYGMPLLYKIQKSS